MDHNIKLKLNTMKRNKAVFTPAMSLETISKVRKFHQSFPEYAPTPLRSLKTLAAQLGVSSIYVKDESYRFGLNAFKVLGGSWAIGQYLAGQLGQDIAELPYNIMTSDKVRSTLGRLTFATTTDGNHGRGVAWTANRLRQNAVVYMPKGSQPIRLENIRSLGAQACITDLNYDDSVRLTAQEAAKNNWVVVQDTAWPGYEQIPTWIMQGYGTMALEALEQLQGTEPTHIFIQAGVGSLAGAVQGFFANVCKTPPTVVVVEPTAADCLYRSAVAADGQPHNVGGDLATIMAGLACGEPSTISWEILKNNTAGFAVCPDRIAADGMRILGNPLSGDDRIISGESGAVPMGLLFALLTDPAYPEYKAQLNITESSRILLFSTEGDTDPKMYRRIVWQGAFPNIKEL